MNTYEYKIDGILLSHVHIDHANDLNIFVELMTEGGQKRRGTLILPNQALENKVLQSYLKQVPEYLHVIKPRTTYHIKNLEIVTSIEHKHGVETYGFIIKAKKNKIGFVTDTAYFPELLKSYQGCERLIMNVPYHLNDKENPKHLDIPAVQEFMKAIQPKKVVLTHFNENMLKANPVKVAENLSKKYSIDVIAAEDDMILKL